MTQQILSSDNQYIKLTASLHQKKHRDETGLFVVEGIRLVQEAVNSSWKLKFAVISEDEAGQERVQRLIDDLDERSCPVMEVPVALFRKISDTENPQGVLAVVHQRIESADELSPTGTSSLWVILDSLQDPGNVGTIIRSADAAGAAGVLIADNCADIYAGKTTRATMGSLFHIPVVKASAAQCLSFCDRCGLALYVAGAEAAISYSDVDLRLPCAIVLGNEGSGVGEEFRRHALKNLKIPIVGQAESLNVASAAAVILFEAARQRGLRL